MVPLREIWIPGEMPSLNEIIGSAKRHWAQYSSTKRKYTGRVVRACKRVKPVEEQVIVHCHWQVKDRRKDPDNIGSGIKYVLDGLVKAGVLPDDGWRQVKAIHHTFEVNKKKPGCMVHLYRVIDQKEGRTA